MRKRNGGTFCRRSADREKPEECLEDNVREGEEALSGVGAKLFRCRNRGTGIFGDGREIGAAEKATILGKKPKKKRSLLDLRPERALERRKVRRMIGAVNVQERNSSCHRGRGVR